MNSYSGAIDRGISFPSRPAFTRLSMEVSATPPQKRQFSLHVWVAFITALLVSLGSASVLALSVIVLCNEPNTEAFIKPLISSLPVIAQQVLLEVEPLVSYLLWLLKAIFQLVLAIFADARHLLEAGGFLLSFKSSAGAAFGVLIIALVQLFTLRD